MLFNLMTQNMMHIGFMVLRKNVQGLGLNITPDLPRESCDT